MKYLDENKIPYMQLSNNYHGDSGSSSSSIFSQSGHGVVSRGGLPPNVMSPSSHSQFSGGHIGNNGVISAVETFDPHAEPEFLTVGKRLEITLGDTVVLPCKLKNLGNN